ncbi:hypothetical protein Staley_32 [Bacillus phage Staley]|uniref:Uncharacterized protein n=1 Tax=Bacillus phage Staley TaxID=1406792 RepID=U5PXI2_9CAUD|nr:hypothetical protein Staley_32 [Bacillus phage Staley]AGY48715.1 hypothetical protein Staley_32 [Bacillus phage Staley]
MSENNFQVFLTRDDKEFKTNVTLGKVNTKDYDLELLELAEQRVQKGTNKSIETALKSLVHLKKGKASIGRKSDPNELELDEYGLHPDLYTPQQISLIRKIIESYYATADVSTPFQQSGVIRLAKLEANIAEVEILVAKKKLKEDIEKLEKLNAMHLKLSDSLKLTTKQASDGAKGEDILSNACIAFEETFANDKFEFPSIELRDRLQEVLISKADLIVKLIGESKTYYHFKKALIESTGLEMSDAEDIGEFTIAELFDCFKIFEDRQMIENKNEVTYDDSIVHRKDEGL